MTEKNIKDYLHLYLESEVEEKVSHKDFCRVLQLNGRNIYNVLKQPQYYKLILRPLSDMSEEEEKECNSIMFGEFGTKHLTNILQWAPGVIYLLSNHFDLFGLIEAGLAIDKTKITQPA